MFRRKSKPISFTEIAEQVRLEQARPIEAGSAVVVMISPAELDRCETCGVCEAETFAGWAARIEEGLPGRIDGPRLVLIRELHGSVADRFPLGIAERLYDVIVKLHEGADQEGTETAWGPDEKACAILRELEHDEYESLFLNPGVLASASERCLTARRYLGRP